VTRETVLILGARSDIARAIARRFAADGYDIQLAARGVERLKADCADISLRHQVDATAHEFDVLATKRFARFIAALPVLPQVVVCCVGYMGDQAQSQSDLDAATLVMRSNYEGPANILAAFSEKFAARGSGTLVGVSSVAGERGRATNYVYGSAKAGFTAFLSGMRNRLAKQGVAVVSVLPGFVNTAMTAGMELPKRLTAQPQEVGEAVFRAVKRGKDVVYVRPIWRLVMFVIRSIPERIFKKLKL
jgi:short-subunit dehydrogenase